MFVHRCALLGALVAIGIGIAEPSARAQVGPNPSVTVTGPPTAAIGSTYEMTVSLYLPQGYYTSLDVSFTFPSAATYPAATWAADGIPADFTRAPTVGSTVHYTAAVVDLRTAAAFRTFKIYAYTSPYTTVVNTPHQFVASVVGNVGEAPNVTPLPGNITGSSTTVATGAPSHSFTAQPWATVAWTHGNTPGVLLTYRVSAGTANRLPTSNPHTYTYTLGSGLTYIRKTPITGDNAVEVSGTPGQVGGTVVQTTPYSEIIDGAIDVFIPCSSLALDSQLNPAYQLGVTYDTNELEWFGGLAGGPQSTNAVHQSATVSLDPWWTTAAAECGAGGAVTKAPLGLDGFGHRPYWRIYVTPPFGVAIDDAMIVDILPSNMAADGLYLVEPEGFTAFACNMSVLHPSGYFNKAQFLAAVGSGACREKDNQTQWVFAGDTHLVLYNPEWTNPGGFFYDVYTVRTTQGDDAYNAVYFNGTWDDGTTTHDVGDQVAEVSDEDPFESLAVRSTTVGPTKTYAYFAWSDFYIDANNGSAAILPYGAWDGSTEMPINPTQTLDIPPGVIVDSWSYYLPYTCPDYPTWQTPQLTDRPMVWRFNNGPSPCAVPPVVYFHLDPNYPFVHGETIDFVNTVLPDTDTAHDYNVAHRYGTVIVAEGMDVKLTASCYDQQPGYGLYKVTAINRGQQDLTHITLTFEVPANATFGGAQIGSAPDVPAGAYLEYSSDGGSSWSTTAGAGVTHVRLNNFGIPGLGINAIRPYFHVLVHPNTTNNVTAKAVMASAELGQTPEKSTTFAVSECRYGSNVHVQFLGGAALPNWTVTISNGSGTVASGTTNANGDFVPSLGFGTYTVTVAPPGATQYLTWNGPMTQTLTVSEQVPTATFTVGCTCNDNEPCTNDSCLSPGVCDFAFDQDCGACSETDPVCASGGWAFYVAVNGPNGQTGVVKCQIGANTSSITCDTNNILDAACE